MESPAVFSHTYRITVEEADGRNHEYDFTAASEPLELGQVLEPEQEGWAGPWVSIEEIDRDPDENQPGAALAWPMHSPSHIASTSRVHAA